MNLPVFTKLKALFPGHSQRAQVGSVQPGLYSYQHTDTGERSHIHLRVHPDGSGFVLVNANRVLHLNPTATLMAYCALEALPHQQAIDCLTQTYRVSKNQAQADYDQFCSQLNELIRPDGSCPVHELELEIIPPFSRQPTAPYRMDLALTYRCNNDCSHCYNARPRDFTEISTSAWKQILDRLWEIGIPHIVFTGGEPTLRDDLPELIGYAQSKGAITGVNTNGRRLSDRSYVQELLQAGLDHVQITLESHQAEIHDRMVLSRGAWRQTVAGIRNALDTPLYVMTNTTLLADNTPSLRQTLDFLAELGVPTVGLNALIYSGKGRQVGSGLPEAELPALLEIARECTQAHGQRLIWYTPTQYCHFDPMQLELGIKGCTAALYSMCIEPDGSVIPCQSYYHPLGKLTENSWEEIWNHELARWLRARSYTPEKCTGCALLSECGGGCPLALPDQLHLNKEPRSQ